MMAFGIEERGQALDCDFCVGCDGTGKTTCFYCRGNGFIDGWDEENALENRDCPVCKGCGRQGICRKCDGTGVKPEIRENVPTKFGLYKKNAHFSIFKSSA